jgi:hypothetical protein
MKAINFSALVAPFSLLLGVVINPFSVHAEEVLLQLVVYSNSEETLSRVLEDSPSVEQELLRAFLASDSMANFQAIEPGEVLPGANGAHRVLPFNNCPAFCANSGSTYCRALGCAFCGGSCARRLLRNAVTSSAYGAAAIEASLNEELARYCTSYTECTLWAKIMLVNPDGTTIELV